MPTCSKGAALFSFSAIRVLPDRYNQILGGSQGVRVLPAVLKDAVSESQYRFDPLEYRHPLVAAFKGREQAGLLTTPIYRYFRLEAASEARGPAWRWDSRGAIRRSSKKRFIAAG